MGNGYLYLDGKVGTGISRSGFPPTFDRIEMVFRPFFNGKTTGNGTIITGNVSGGVTTSFSTGLETITGGSTVTIDGTTVVNGTDFILEGAKITISISVTPTTGYTYFLAQNGLQGGNMEANVYAINLYSGSSLVVNYDFTNQTSGSTVADSLGGAEMSLFGGYAWRTEPTITTPPTYDQRTITLTERGKEVFDSGVRR